MTGVAVLGSINVDRVAFVDGAELDALEAHEWFPRPGETRTTEGVPDPLVGGEFERFTGGKGANQAVAAARAGAATSMFGLVGGDGPDALGALRAAGVDVGGVGEVDGPTGRAYVFVDDGGENRILVVPGANGMVDAGYARRQRPAIRDADCLLLQNEVPIPAMTALLDDLEGTDRRTVIFDPAPAEGAAPLLEHPSVDVVTPNAAEHDHLEAAIRAFEGVVIRTRGPEDVTVEDGDRFAVSPPAVDVVDSTAAGDVFNGFLAARLSAGDDLRDAVEVATVAASLSTGSEGAQDSVPTLEEVRAFADQRV